MTNTIINLLLGLIKVYSSVFITVEIFHFSFLSFSFIVKFSYF